MAVLFRRTRAAKAAREGVGICLLYLGWIGIGMLTHPYVEGAQERARQLYAFEKALYLPDELAVQQLVLPHPWLSHLANGYYLYGHLNVIGLTLLWVWLRHRDGYAALRIQLIVLTVVSEAIQIFALAPPRLMPELGFVDLARVYGESVYGDFGTGVPSQLLAMPSLHVGWAAVVAWAVWKHAPGVWRWVGVTHLVLMSLVVVVTANHWWLDGIVAMVILAAVVVAMESGKRSADKPQILVEA